MQVRARHASGRADEPDRLTALNCVTFGDERFAHVKVCRNDTRSVIDVHNVAGEKEIVNERNNSTVGCNDGVSRLSPKVDPKMAAREPAIEHAA